jgi:hypothetical protein
MAPFVTAITGPRDGVRYRCARYRTNGNALTLSERTEYTAPLCDKFIGKGFGGARCTRPGHDGGKSAPMRSVTIDSGYGLRLVRHVAS